MKVVVKDFVSEFVEKKITNNKINPNAIEDFIRSKLEITEYIPFRTKREIVEMIVEKVITEEDGIKRVDGISQFLSFIVAMVASHTTLAFSDKPEEDYDALSRCGLLEHIVAMFKKDVDECDVLLKIAIADELADNNLNVIIGKFFNGVADTLRGFAEKADASKLFGESINKEDIAKLIGVLDKLK